MYSALPHTQTSQRSTLKPDKQIFTGRSMVHVLRPLPDNDGRYGCVS